MNTQQTLGRWIRVKPDNYVEPTKEMEAGTFISPYDIPNGVRGTYDEELERFVVEFRYMVDEKYRCLGNDEGVCIRLGKHSSRIVGIEVDVDRLRTSRATVAVEARNDEAYAAIKQAIQDVENAEDARARRRENYVVVRKVLADKKDDVFDSMQHAVAR